MKITPISIPIHCQGYTYFFRVFLVTGGDPNIQIRNIQIVKTRGFQDIQVVLDNIPAEFGNDHRLLNMVVLAHVLGRDFELRDFLKEYSL